MRRCSRRSWRWAMSRSTSSARRARSTLMPARSRARAATRIRSPICATPTISATSCWSSSPTAISPSPSSGNSSMPPSYIPSGARSRAATLAAIAAKAEKEAAYHLRHASEWLIRLGDGTAESHRRAQAALDELWPYAGEMFESDAVEQALIAQGIAVDPTLLQAEWERSVDSVLAEATLARPTAGWMQSGGRSGRHSEHLGHLLAEMQFLQRAYPGATW